MKRLTTLLTALAAAIGGASGASLYVSPNGDDSNDGSINKPFKTIQCGVDNLSEGDICYLRQGLYRENVIIDKSNVQLAAYNDEYVVISGGELVSGWESYKGEIYRAKVEDVEPQFTQVVYNGELQKMARYPDHTTDDMFSIEDDSGYIGLETKEWGGVTFDEPLPGGKNYWKGGYFRAVAAKAGATNPNGLIESSEGREVQCTEISKIWESCSKGSQPWKAIGKGKGYIFHLTALSCEGEWYYEDGYLYFWQPGGGKPADGTIEVQKRDYTVTVDGQNNVSLDGLNIRLASIKLDNVADCEVNRSTFRDIKGWIFRKSYGTSYTELGGTYVNGQNIKFQDTYFAGSWGNLLCLNKCDGVLIDNCIFEDNGWMGFFTSSVQSNSDNLTITNSTFRSTGRFHLRSDGHAHIIFKHNDMSDCMKMCQDAGSIELTNSGLLPDAMDMKGSVFAYNKFHDMNTLPGWTRNTQFVLALYFEGAENYTVHHNLFYNITNDRREGTFLYLGPRYTEIKDCFFYNNTVWNIDDRIHIWNYERNGHKGGIENMHFANNIFMSGMKDKFGEQLVWSQASHLQIM